jgi:hypothetical protein
MVSGGQEAWSKLLEDIKSVNGWPYPGPFHETMELYRQTTICYDNNLLDATVVLGRAIIDGALFDAVTNPPFSTEGSYVCIHCGKEVVGGLNGLQAHEQKDHNEAKQWWDERRNFLETTLTKKLEAFSKHKKYSDYTDSWDDYDKGGKIGLANLATLSGLLECEELEEISREIRKKAAVRLHRIARSKAYEDWRGTNAEKMKLLIDKRISVKEIEWFSWSSADKLEAKKVLNMVGKYLGTIVRRYEGIWR